MLDLDASIFVLPVAPCGMNICLSTPLQGSHRGRTHPDGYSDAPSAEGAHLPPAAAGGLLGSPAAISASLWEQIRMLINWLEFARKCGFVAQGYPQGLDPSITLPPSLVLGRWE